MVISKQDNQDYTEKLIIKEYKKVAMRMLPLSFPNLSIYEIEQAVDYSISNRIYNETDCVLYNNYKEKRTQVSIIDMCEYIMSQEPIVTSFGTLFRKNAKNPLVDMIMSFLADRKKHKKIMFTFPKGSNEFAKYNLFQLLDKRDANSIYGGLGNYSCLFFNLHVAPSITTQSRAAISSAGLQFEMFLANGSKFESLNEVVTFIDNICQEKSERKYKDEDLLTHIPTVDECFAKVIMTCGFNYVPSLEDLDIIWNILCELDQEDITRIYYKNNLYEFMENPSMLSALDYLLKTLETPFMDPNTPPKEIQAELDEFTDILMEYIYYHHHIVDRIDKYHNMIRNVCIITDTDSSIVSVDAWLRFSLDRVGHEDMKIKHQLLSVYKTLERDQFGDQTTEPHVLSHIEEETDYSFYDDELIQAKRLMNVMHVVPQEGLRYSIINIISYVLGKVVNDYMVRFTVNANSYREDKPCLLTMKNEFLFKRILLADVKKNYASIQELQEGHIVPKEAGMDIKGLAMMKSVTNKKTQEKLKEIMYRDILNAGENIDVLEVLKDLAKFEKEMINDIRGGSKELFKPKKIKNISNYDSPMSISGIKEAIVWNAVKDDGAEGIDLNEENHVVLIKTVITPSNIEEIKDSYPETYFKFKEVMKQSEFESLIKGIALPRNIETPSWILNFIDYNTILNDNLHLFPLEPIGIYRQSDNNNYSNILSL